jgi:uncharacterized repeat protein (TIGR04042 family)
MPEMRFHIRWPNGEEQSCYSPSLVIKDFFSPGSSYPLAEFLSRSREALSIASDRVKARYGVPCGRALGQLQTLEAAGQRFMADPSAAVIVLAFND